MWIVYHINQNLKLRDLILETLVERGHFIGSNINNYNKTVSVSDSDGELLNSNWVINRLLDNNNVEDHKLGSLDKLFSDPELHRIYESKIFELGDYKYSWKDGKFQAEGSCVKLSLEEVKEICQEGEKHVKKSL